MGSGSRNNGDTGLAVSGVRLRGGDGDGGTEQGGAEELRLPAGSLTLIWGPNGAGKTVLLEKLAGLRDPEGLSVRFGAEPLWISRGRRRRLNPMALLKYAYAAQSPEQALFRGSLEEEMAFSSRPFRKLREPSSSFDDALEAVGWDRSWLERDPYRMSGGERRRAALACLFATPAPWLLLDEPTAGLDRDGHEKLARHLTRLKEEGRGILLVSHDSDWALPLADRVLLVHPGGQLRYCSAEALVTRPEWLLEAGLPIPSWLKVVSGIWQNGEGEAREPLSRLWDPAVAADRISDGGLIFDAAAEFRDGSVADPGKTAETAVPARREPAASHRLGGFDPRAVWLGYMLVSAGLFSLSGWWGLLAGGGIVAALLFSFRIPLLRWKGLIAGFAYFAVALASFAAIASPLTETGRLGWDAEAFTGTLFPFARTMSVLLIGLGLPIVMTPLTLRRALEQMTSRHGRTTPFWQRILLTVALTIRFVPVLLAEWERFGRIYLARGKVTARTPWTLARRLKEVALPFLLSLFRLGDEVATALESRGVRRDVHPTPGPRLRWRWKDTAFSAGAAAIAAGMWLLG